MIPSSACSRQGDVLRRYGWQGWSAKPEAAHRRGMAPSHSSRPHAPLTASTALVVVLANARCPILPDVEQACTAADAQKREVLQRTGHAYRRHATKLASESDKTHRAG